VEVEEKIEEEKAVPSETEKTGEAEAMETAEESAQEPVVEKEEEEAAPVEAPTTTSTINGQGKYELNAKR